MINSMTATTKIVGKKNKKMNLKSFKKCYRFSNELTNRQNTISCCHDTDRCVKILNGRLRMNMPHDSRTESTFPQVEMANSLDP